MLKDLIWRTCAVTLSAVLAMVIPRLGLFLNLVGSMACTALAFILPVIIYDKLHTEEISRRQKWFHRFLIIFGVVAGGLSSAISVYKLVLAFGSS
jgi:amino acid permease